MDTYKMMLFTKKNFTLIELVVVIAIMAVLAAIITPNALRAIEKAKISRAAEDMNAIRAAALSFYADTGTWPQRGLGGAVRASGKGFNALSKMPNEYAIARP